MIQQGSYRIFMLYVKRFYIVFSYISFFMITFYQVLYAKQSIDKAQDSINTQQIQTYPNTTHNTLQTYSIIHDLRTAFEPYSSMDTQYQAILKNYNEMLKNTQDSSTYPQNTMSIQKRLDSKSFHTQNSSKSLGLDSKTNATSHTQTKQDSIPRQETQDIESNFTPDAKEARESTLHVSTQNTKHSHNVAPDSTNSPLNPIITQGLDSTNRYATYRDFLAILDTFCCSVSLPNTIINSFDLRDSKQALQHIESRLKDSIPQDSPLKDSMQNTQNLAQKQDTKSKQNNTKTTINTSLLAPKCVKKKFNITKDEKLNIHTLLHALAKECDFSIQYTHNAKQNLHNQQNITLNIRDKPLDFVLEMLLSDMFYSIDRNRLIISDISMQMFAINYISSTRMAQSNTDVLFAQEQHENYGLGYNGFYNSMTPNYTQNYSTQNYAWQNLANTQTSQRENQSMSGYLDNLSLRNQLRSQMSSANARFGKSGTKVYSLDEINFWADIESKLHIMLDTKIGDKFMIDKGAGLIAVWTTKQKMREVSQFLQDLEQKMNMQVAIDVEILSLIHFQTNNVGIDWQQIFSILNPTQSSLNIAFGGGGAMLTLGNNNADLQSIFNLLRTYGDLRSLSNPKIMALNNQPALISVGSVLRYTQNLVYQSNNTNTTIQNTSTQDPSVFAGILLDITPSISHDSVILRINPSITKTKDPDMENAAEALKAPPNLSTNQLSSIVKLKDGERVIIGGLLNNVVQNTSQAIPKIGETKWLKNIFGKQSRTNRSEELIIIITPHIIR